MDFFPYGLLFCLTLFCFVAIRVFEIQKRYRTDQNTILELKKRLAKGQLEEAEYQRLINLIKK